MRWFKHSNRASARVAAALLVVAGLAFGVLVYGATRPVLRCNEELDLGTVRPGEDVRFGINVGNQGVFPLRIEEVETSCNCFAAFEEKVEIEGKGRHEIPMLISVPGREEKMEFDVVIGSNDSRNPTRKVSVRLTARYEVKVNPREPIVTTSAFGTGLSGNRIEVQTAAGRFVDWKVQEPFSLFEVNRTAESESCVVIELEPKWPGLSGEFRTRVDFSYKNAGNGEWKTEDIDVCGVLSRDVHAAPTVIRTADVASGEIVDVEFVGAPTYEPQVEIDGRFRKFFEIGEKRPSRVGLKISPSGVPERFCNVFFRWPEDNVRVSVPVFFESSDLRRGRVPTIATSNGEEVAAGQEQGEEQGEEQGQGQGQGQEQEQEEGEAGDGDDSKASGSTDRGGTETASAE